MPLFYHRTHTNALKQLISAVVIGGCGLWSPVNIAAEYLVANLRAYEQTLPQLEPGDTLRLANGVWRDAELLFSGHGTAEKPITLTAETAGKVVLSGQSNLRLSGEHLRVKGLVFKDGYTPTASVISFRESPDKNANHTRVTEVVIDHFNHPERTETDYWISLYGQHNRLDHSHISGKSNRGVTVAVKLDTDASRNNYHRIDHNYFGPRPILGSNGGETLRVGTSHHSLTDSRTLIDNNYFDRCDGEVEIISIKSGGNTLRGNVFVESQGALTLRHGSNTLVEDNVFLGNGKDHTGGIRVINSDQTVRNNYLEGLTGYRFGGGLVVMNGVPNSPAYRYHQVNNAQIDNNSFINVEHIQLAAGSDQERSAVPINSHMHRNLFYTSIARQIFTVYDDISGVDIADNLQNHSSSFGKQNKFTTREVKLHKGANGLKYPIDPQLARFGVSRDLTPITKAETGVTWYTKPVREARFDHGQRHAVTPTPMELAEVIKQAEAGDQIVLQAGDYLIDRVLPIRVPLTIRSASGSDSDSVRIQFTRSTLFEVQDGGSLKLAGLSISGAMSPDSTGNAVVRTQRSSMLNNYELLVENTQVVDLNINRSFDFLSSSKSTFADNIEIHGSEFRNMTGSVLNLNSETDDYGIYNAEYVTIRDSNFSEVEGTVINYYRGGVDESTFGPHLEFMGNTLNKVGHGKRNTVKASILLHGVQVTNISQNQLTDSAPIIVRHTVGEPITTITDNDFTNTPVIDVAELFSKQVNTAMLARNRYR